MKKTLLTTALTVALSTSAFATSYYHEHNHGETTSNVGLQNSAYDFKSVGLPNPSGITLFDYVEPSQYVQTNILAFYTQDLLDQLGGDVTQVYAFIDKSLEYNNKAFEYGGIGIRRGLAGIIKLPDDFDNARLNGSGGINYFNNFIIGVDSNSDPSRSAVGSRYADYSASYFLLFTAHDNSSNRVGQSKLGRNVAYTTAHGGNAYDSLSTAAHELGHNDGMEHDRSERDFDFSWHLSEYGIAAVCNNKQTIMGTGGFGVKHPFFADPNVEVTANGEQCGIEDVADVSRAYRDYVSQDFFETRRGILLEYEEALPNNGVVSLVMDTTASEANGVIRGTVVWDGLTQDQNAFVNVVIDNYRDTSPSDFVTQDVHIEYTGQSTTDFEIQLADDSATETDERVSFKLHAANGVRIDSTQDTATVVVASDEQPSSGSVSFSQDSISGSEGDTVNVTLERSGGSAGAITVTLDLSFGTANDDDLTLSAQSVSFGDGETSKTVSIALNNDTLEEGTETATLSLSNATTDSSDSITVTITDSTESSTPPTTTPPANSSDSSSGGGSTGFGIFALALVAWFRRMK